jgi:hypothetical protein
MAPGPLSISGWCTAVSRSGSSNPASHRRRGTVPASPTYRAAPAGQPRRPSSYCASEPSCHPLSATARQRRATPTPAQPTSWRRATANAGEPGGGPLWNPHPPASLRRRDTSTPSSTDTYRRCRQFRHAREAITNLPWCVENQNVLKDEETRNGAQVVGQVVVEIPIL